MDQLPVVRRFDGELVALLRACQRAYASGEGTAERFLEAARDELMTELYPRMRSFLMAKLGRVGRRHRDVVDDVTQDAMLRIARALGDCRATTDGALVEWAVVTAQRTLIDAIRSPSSPIASAVLTTELRDHVRDLLSGDPPDGDVPMHAPGFRVLVEVAMAAYETLDPEVRSVFWWKLVGGWGWPDVARALGTTAAGAKRRYQRGQETLRREAVRLIGLLPEHDRLAVRRILDRTAAVDATHADSSSAA